LRIASRKSVTDIAALAEVTGIRSDRVMLKINIVAIVRVSLKRKAVIGLSPPWSI
jgi:hypothetical protein